MAAVRKARLDWNRACLSIFVDPSQLPVQDFFGPDAARYIDFVKSCKPATAGNPVLVPGEVEVERRQERTDNGIELDNKTWQQIVASAQECGVSQSLIDKVIKS